MPAKSLLNKQFECFAGPEDEEFVIPPWSNLTADDARGKLSAKEHWADLGLLPVRGEFYNDLFALYVVAHNQDELGQVLARLEEQDVTPYRQEAPRHWPDSNVYVFTAFIENERLAEIAQIEGVGCIRPIEDTIDIRRQIVEELEANMQ
jgi:hypothetical protein